MKLRQWIAQRRYRISSKGNPWAVAAFPRPAPAVRHPRCRRRRQGTETRLGLLQAEPEPLAVADIPILCKEERFVQLSLVNLVAEIPPDRPAREHLGECIEFVRDHAARSIEVVVSDDDIARS